MTTFFRFVLITGLVILTLVGCATTPDPPLQVTAAPAASSPYEASEAVAATEAERELLPGESPDPRLAQVLEDKGLSQLEAQLTAIRKQGGLDVVAMSVDLESATIALPPAKDSDEIRIHVLPVGAGACHLVECPGADSAPMLVDCGSTKVVPGVDWAEATVLDYIRRVLNGRAVNVVVSHADADHYKYIPAAVPASQVRTLWLGGAHGEYPTSFLQWANAVRDRGTATNPRVTEPFPVNWHNDGYAVSGLACGVAHSFVLGVNNGDSKNDHSLMLSIDYGDFRAIFPGDASAKSQDAAIANFPDDYLYSTVLIASHHGANTHGSNNDRWARATLPQYVVYPAGDSYGHPRCEVVETFRVIGRLTAVEDHSLSCGMSGTSYDAEQTELGEYNTHQSGAVVLTSDATGRNVDVQCLPDGC